MILHDQEGESALVLGSCVFYGFRFNVGADNVKFDYDTYLANKDDAEKMLNCRILPIDMLSGEYAVTLKDIYSFQSRVAPNFYVSRSFKVREITDKDMEHLQEFAKFFGIPFTEPAWRHALTRALITKEYKEAEMHEPVEENV